MNNTDCPVNKEIDEQDLQDVKRLHKKTKREAKKLEKQKKREQKELIVQLQPKSNSVTLITRDLANKVIGNVAVPSAQNVPVDVTNFPELGVNYKSGSSKNNFVQSNTEPIDAANKNKGTLQIDLSYFLNKAHAPNTKQTQAKHNTKEVKHSYNGNPLDSDLPERKRGKCREVPKTKRHSKLKQGILQDKESVLDQTLDINQTPSIYDHFITDELNNSVKEFISLIVERQEKLYKRDAIKGTSRRKYIVGLHETKKYLNLNRVKILVLAADLQIVKENGVLDSVVNEMVTLAKANNVPYLFALRRRKLGILTLKFIPVSCIAILNYEGLENYFNDIVKLVSHLKEEYQKTNRLHVNQSESTSSEDVNIHLLNNLKEALITDT